MRSHRLNPDKSNDTPYDEVAGVGADDRTFPTGVNHIINHTVAGSHPLPETKVGSFIKDVGDAPSVFHGVEPSVSREVVESEYERRQKEATFSTSSNTAPNYYPDPVPVVIVPAGVGANSLKSWSGTFVQVPTDSAIGITGRNYDQTRVILYNEDPTNYVRVARTANGAAMGAIIPPLKEREFFVQEAIYAIANTAPVRLSIFIEYGVDE